ncbi:hypothetical protein MAR_015157 [Mya arenaria]|uniref:Uncharacterized protein n=1 Tax=Mya arenaria TaxID=6604 RepID=A0ABY7FG78_MYAAR|nr:hypothetical protein MAR_015157 [Mya arenaria]
MDLLFMILVVISVFCIRLFASTNIEATSVIIKRKNIHINTPVEKNRSCALLATNIDVTNMTDTCPYPELFSYETGTCEMFYLVIIQIQIAPGKIQITIRCASVNQTMTSITLSVMHSTNKTGCTTGQADVGNHIT